MQERLCGMWGVSAGLISSRLPWMRATSLRLRLESHLHYIFTADWLVKFEGGLTNLPENDLNKVNELYMYQHPNITFYMYDVKWCSTLACESNSRTYTLI